jgi:thiol-disulfide isomerase/thioredoxin
MVCCASGAFHSGNRRQTGIDFDEEAYKDFDNNENTFVEMTNGVESVKEILEGNYNFLVCFFYTPWCTQCQKMTKEVEKAMQKVWDEDRRKDIAFVKLDATRFENLSMIDYYGVQSFPDLKLFKKGLLNEDDELVHTSFHCQRRAHDVVRWVREKVRNRFIDAKNKETLREKLKKRDWEMNQLAFSIEGPVDFDELPPPRKKFVTDCSQIFSHLANTPPLTYYAPCPELAQNVPGFFGRMLGWFGLGGEDRTIRIKIYRGNTEEAEYSGPLKASAVGKWVIPQRVAYFGQLNYYNQDDLIQQGRIGILWFCLDPTDLKNQVMKVNEAAMRVSMKEDYPFVWMDVTQHAQYARDEVKCLAYPSVTLQTGDVLCYVPQETERYRRSFADKGITEEGLEQFFADIREGRLQKDDRKDDDQSYTEAMDANNLANLEVRARGDKDHDAKGFKMCTRIPKDLSKHNVVKMMISNKGKKSANSHSADL